MNPISDQEWEQLSVWYQDKVKTIRIRENADPNDLRSVISRIDEVLNHAVFDYARAQYDFANNDAQLEIQTSRYFLEGKNATRETNGRGGIGMSDEKAKHYSRFQVEQKGFVESQAKTQYRMTFLKNIIFLMEQKRQLLMIMHGINKIENGFFNFQ
jgi:hypothetical protein